MRCRNCFVTVPLVSGLASFAAGCCPSTAGPTAPAASYSMTLAPGEVRFFDADTPDSTTQINLTFRIESVDALLRLRQIDPGCLPGPGDACQNLLRYDAHAAARRGRDVRKRPAPHGLRTRVVLENPSADTSMTVGLTIEPRRAGCT